MEKKVKNPDDYSWIKVHKKHLKNKFLVFSSGLIKNFKKISWTNKKQLCEEFLLVIAIVLFLTAFFYLIFIFITFVQK